MSRGKIIILSGPSGVGKGTIVKQLLARYPHLTLSVSATTRAPREGEVDGREYYFITKDDFEARIAQGQMLEYARYVEQTIVYVRDSHLLICIMRDVTDEESEREKKRAVSVNIA